MLFAREAWCLANVSCVSPSSSSSRAINKGYNSKLFYADLKCTAHLLKHRRVPNTHLSSRTTSLAVSSRTVIGCRRHLIFDLDCQ